MLIKWHVLFPSPNSAHIFHCFHACYESSSLQRAPFHNNGRPNIVIKSAIYEAIYHVISFSHTISWTDHVRNEEVLFRVKEQRNILHETRKRKANLIGHILRRNCLLQRVTEGKIQGGKK